MLAKSTTYGLGEWFHTSEHFFCVVTDLKGAFLYANPLFQSSCFALPNSFQAERFQSKLSEQDVPKYQQVLQQCATDSNAPVAATLHMKLADGSLQWVKWEFHTITDAGGQSESIRAIGVAIPAAAEKNTDEVLKEKEARLRLQATILENVTDIIVTTDLSRNITSWNKAAEKLTGVNETDAIGKPFHKVFEIDYTPYTEDNILKTILSFGVWRGEISYAGADGEKNWLLLAGYLIYDEKGNRTGLLGVGKDITKGKRAEEGLQDSELFYRNLISHSLDGIVMADATGKITYYGPSATKISGHQVENMLGKCLFEFVHPDDRALATEAFMLEFKKESLTSYLLLRLRHANGDWIWCKVRGHNLLDNPGFNSIVIYFTDDTKRKMIEDQLKESEHRFRNLVYNLKQGVLLQDEKGKLILVNSATLQMLGVTEDQLAGNSPFDFQWNLMYEGNSDLPQGILPGQVVIQTRKPVRDVVIKVSRPAANDYVWLLVNADPIFDADANLMYVICSFTDITEQRRLAKELTEQAIQKQKQITQATIDAQEKERLLIGKELHDNISQHLTTTRLYLEVAKEKIAGEMKDMVSFSHENLVATIHEIRSLSQSLAPPSLGDIGLVESVHDLADTVKQLHNISIDFYCRHFDEYHLPANLKLMLFRVMQEQLNNIVRHAGATSVEIRLQSDAEFITLTITDDGEASDINSYKKNPAFENIANRVSLFNGVVEKEFQPGRGCILSINVPAPSAETVEN